MWLQLWQRNTLIKGFAPTAGSLPIGRISVPQLPHSPDVHDFFHTEWCLKPMRTITA
jgi:hypothetical protein